MLLESSIIGRRGGGFSTESPDDVLFCVGVDLERNSRVSLGFHERFRCQHTGMVNASLG